LKKKTAVRRKTQNDAGGVIRWVLPPANWGGRRLKRTSPEKKKGNSKKARGIKKKLGSQGEKIHAGNA